MALMHLLYFDEIQAFRHTHECRHHDYYNEELQRLPSTSMYRMHEGVGGCRPPKDEVAFSVKGTVYNSKSSTLCIKCNMCKAVI